MRRIRISWWQAVPILLVLCFYWRGLDTWFYQDDFGWLNVLVDVHGWRDVLPALFVPKAHGNMRPWSETGFFMAFSALFGIDALPFRIWVFLTQAANLVLLGDIARRLTGSRAAGFWAQVLWGANCGVAAVMCWTSIYNQALCGFFLLLAFRFLLLHIETGRARFEYAQWAAFLLGFGAMETNIVYPALAASYTLLRARPLFRRTLPLFAASAVYGILHFAVAPAPASGVYAIHADIRLFSTFQQYWLWALGPARLAEIRTLPPWTVLVAGATLTGAAIALLLRDRLAVFFAAWFVLTLAPVLPLPDHVMDYYLAVPTLGLAMLGALGLARAWRGRWFAKTAAAALVAVYLGASIPASWAVARWNHARSHAVQDMVLGVAELHRREPGKIILLSGVNSDLFYAGIAHVPFRVLGIPHVYLVPGSEGAIRPATDLATKFVLPPEMALRELRAGRAVVYEAGGPVLKNVTTRYRALAEAQWRPGWPRFVNPGDPLFSEFLSASWQPCRDGYREMGDRGSIRMGGPRNRAERLYLGMLGPAPARVAVDGVDLHPGEGSGMVLPEASLGKDVIEVTVEGRGITFGFAEIR